MNLLELPIVAAFSFLTALLFGLAAQQLLGIRLGIVRLFIAGIFALLIGPPIMLAIVGDAGASQTDPSIQVWFVLLGMACTVLASMVVLVLIEAFVPVGTVPPPLVWGRGRRARLARTRRYWQLVVLGIRTWGRTCATSAGVDSILRTGAPSSAGRWPVRSTPGVSRSSSSARCSRRGETSYQPK
jgi:ubiquinone biosynthesis protein